MQGQEPDRPAAEDRESSAGTSGPELADRGVSVQIEVLDDGVGGVATGARPGRWIVGDIILSTADRLRCTFESTHPPGATLKRGSAPEHAAVTYGLVFDAAYVDLDATAAEAKPDACGRWTRWTSCGPEVMIPGAIPSRVRDAMTHHSWLAPEERWWYGYPVRHRRSMRTTRGIVNRKA